MPHLRCSLPVSASKATPVNQASLGSHMNNYYIGLCPGFCQQECGCRAQPQPPQESERPYWQHFCLAVKQRPVRRQHRPPLPPRNPGHQGEEVKPITHAGAATPGSPRTLNALVTLLLHSKLCLQDPVHGHLLGGSPSPLPIPVLVLPPLPLLLHRCGGGGGGEDKTESQRPAPGDWDRCLGPIRV